MASGSDSKSISKYWHGTSPKREITEGTLKVSYNDLKLSASVSVTNKFWYSGWQSQSMKDTLYLILDGNTKIASDEYELPSSWSSTFTKKMSCSGDKTVTAGSHTVSVYMHCSDSDCGSHAYSGYGIQIGSLSITVPNPYTAPKVEITSVTTLGKKGNSNYKIQVKYNVTKGTDNLTKTYAVIYNNDNGKIEELDMNTTQTGPGKTVSFTIPNTDKYAHGTKYKVAIKITDGTSTKETSKLRFYSYTEPTLTKLTVTKTDTTSPVLATSDSSTIAEINARTGFQFNLSGTNNAKWTEQGEKEFKTRFKTNYDNEYTSDSYDGKANSERSVGNTTAYGLSVANTRKLFPPDHNGTVYDATSKQISFARYGSSTDWYSGWKTVEIKVYYRPRQMVTGVQFGKDSSSSNWKTPTQDAADARIYTLTDDNRIITNPNSYTSIFVKWTYDDTTPESGYIQGYKVILQYNSPVDGWMDYKTYYTSNKYQEIKKADIPRIYKSRVKIIPYYKHNESNVDNYWYATSGYQVTTDFFTIVSPLDTPVIEYPINNTTWHNQDFRVCFKLPIDPDMAWLKTNEPTIYNSYTYHNIEIKVDSNVYRLNDGAGYTETGIKYADMFSLITDGLTYQAPVVIHAAKHYSTTASSHTIQVRVKKRLGTTTDRTMWTSWCTARTVKVSHPVYDVTALNTYIQATHYNTLYDMISNISKVYNITWSNAPLKVAARTTVVDNSQYTYNSMIKVLSDIKTKINNYATFDSSRTTVEIDSSNNLTSSSNWNVKANVLVTAEKDKPNETWNNNYNQGKEGHNYIKWVYEQCDYLK